MFRQWLENFQFSALYLQVNQGIYREEKILLSGNPQKIKDVCGWSPKHTWEDVCTSMVKEAKVASQKVESQQKDFISIDAMTSPSGSPAIFGVPLNKELSQGNSSAVLASPAPLLSSSSSAPHKL